MREKFGLVLSGGGAKGAYQIGVWKALKETGLDSKIKAVSGTSVGALNGALFCQGDWEAAEEIWLNITFSKILAPDIKLLASHALKALLFKSSIPIKLALLGKSIYDHGLFSRNGLISISEKYFKPELIKKSKIPLYVCTLNSSTGSLITTKLNTRSIESIRTILLATSAIPFIFRRERVGRERHLDGGIVPFINNNMPFEVLISKEKCTSLIVVSLNNKPDLKAQKKYPEINFINIHPSEKFEGRIPTLNFSSKGSERLIARGYNDGIRIIKERLI